MKSKAKLGWFTLLEMLIVMVIIWILAVVLCESYITISKIALKVEQEKNMAEESLVLTQIFQSIADEATIDYETYKEHHINLEKDWWFTNVLYLTWWQWSWTSIYTSGNCLRIDWNFDSDEFGNVLPDENGYIQQPQDYSGCSIILEQGTGSTNLNVPWKVIISEAKFRIVPYNTDDEYFNNDDYQGLTVIDKIHQPAFWMFIHLYAPLYQPIWTNKIEQPLQLFFNLNS